MKFDRTVSESSTSPRESRVETGEEWPWYLAFTKPQQERVAAEQLACQGYKTYLPLYKTYKIGNRRTSRLGYQPMFARYVFFRPSTERQGLSAVRSTRGVVNMVSFGSGPATVAPRLLDAIRAIEEERDTADMSALSPFQPGAHVRLRAPSMRGLMGTVLSATTNRVTIVIEILGRQQIVDVDHEMLDLN